VFVVEHRELGSEFVAKLLHHHLLSDPQVVDRVRIEAQALGRLCHPNIVSVVGYGLTTDHRPYIVTEYLRGQTLGAHLAMVGRLNPLDALVYATQILWALAATHELGIIHRDIKPENLFLVEQPNGVSPIKVLDFGLARVIPGVSERAPLPLVLPTDTGVIVGTLRYISPEAAAGNHVDHRADIYSVGVVLYQMLTGRCPFDHAKENASLLVAHVTEQPKPPSHFTRIPLGAALDALVLEALEKSPEQRYQSAREFERAIAEVMAKLLEANEALLTVDTVETTQPLPLVNKTAASAEPQPDTAASSSANRGGLFLYVLAALAAAIAVAVIAYFGGMR
jgi:serine/threonine-protein kinase